MKNLLNVQELSMKKLLNSSISHRISKHSRKKKFNLFKRVVDATDAKTILDVGVGVEWQGAQNTLHEVYSQDSVDENFAGTGRLNGVLCCEQMDKAAVFSSKSKLQSLCIEKTAEKARKIVKTWHHGYPSRFIPRLHA